MIRIAAAITAAWILPICGGILLIIKIMEEKHDDERKD